MIQMDRGVPSGLGNAFTTPGSARPIPPDIGTPTNGGNAFSQPSPNFGQQLAMLAPPTNQLAVASQPTAPNKVPQLLAVLRDSLYPSQREWARDVDPEGPLRLEGQVLEDGGAGVGGATAKSQRNLLLYLDIPRARRYCALLRHPLGARIVEPSATADRRAAQTRCPCMRRSSTLPFAVGTMGSKDMDRSSTSLSNPAVKKK